MDDDGRSGARLRLTTIQPRRSGVGVDVRCGSQTISAVFGEDGEWHVAGSVGRASSLFLDQALAEAAGLAVDDAIRLAAAIHDRLGAAR